MPENSLTVAVDKMTFYLKLQISLAETIINYPFHRPEPTGTCTLRWWLDQMDEVLAAHWHHSI